MSADAGEANANIMVRRTRITYDMTIYPRIIIGTSTVNYKCRNIIHYDDFEFKEFIHLLIERQIFIILDRVIA